jgi:cell wall-associated NlpC family hydrolase
VLKWLAAGVIAVIIVPLALILLVGSSSAASLSGSGLTGGPSAMAVADIPPGYLTLYIGAAQTCPGLPWGVLAGIGKVESDHGRSHLPGVHSGANNAGAEGPMQFEPATFAEFAVNAGHTGTPSPYDPADAIYTAAAMLCADGASSAAPAGIERAVFAYNHSDAYVIDVLTWASRYTVPAPSMIAATAIAFAIRQVGKPYQWGADGPDSFDCSGLVFAAYASAGIAIARTTFGWRQDGPQVPLAEIQPGDLLFSAGGDGTPTHPGHVVMYLGGGMVIQAPQPGQDVQIDPLDLSGVVVATRPSALTPVT